MEYHAELATKGQKRSITASALDGDEALKAGVEVPVWSKQVAQDENLWLGYGVEAREYAEAFSFLALVDKTNGNAIAGELVVRITNSRQDRVIASTTVDNLGELADAQASERTDRPVMAALAPYASPGRHIEIAINADPGSDGVKIDPAASAGRLYYGQIS